MQKKTDEILNRQDKENFIRQIIKLRQDRADKNLKEATENAKKEASAIVPTTQANILEVPNPIVNLENLVFFFNWKYLRNSSLVKI